MDEKQQLNATAERYRRALELERVTMGRLLEVDPSERAQARRNFQAAVQERERLEHLLVAAGRELPPPSSFPPLD